MSNAIYAQYRILYGNRKSHILYFFLKIYNAHIILELNNSDSSYNMEKRE